MLGNNIQIVQLLLDNGADIDRVTFDIYDQDEDEREIMKGQWHNTAFATALSLGNEKAAELLLTYGADISGKKIMML